MPKSGSRAVCLFGVNGSTLESSTPSYQFGEFTLEHRQGCVLKAGAEIKLRPKVYETLKYLVEHPGPTGRQAGTDAGGVA